MVLIYLVEVTPPNMRNPSLLVTQCCSAFLVKTASMCEVIKQKHIGQPDYLSQLHQGQVSHQFKEHVKVQMALGSKLQIRLQECIQTPESKETYFYS